MLNRCYSWQNNTRCKQSIMPPEIPAQKKNWLWLDIFQSEGQTRDQGDAHQNFLKVFYSTALMAVKNEFCVSKSKKLKEQLLMMAWLEQIYVTIVWKQAESLTCLFILPFICQSGVLLSVIASAYFEKKILIFTGMRWWLYGKEITS